MRPEVIISKPDNGNDKKVASFVREYLDHALSYLDEQDVDLMKWQQDRGYVLECVDADKRNALLGVITLRPPDPGANHSVEIAELIVLEKLRRQGIGKKLVTAVIQLAQEQNATALEVSSVREAIGFYQKLGFKLIEPIQKDFTKMQMNI